MWNGLTGCSGDLRQISVSQRVKTWDHFEDIRCAFVRRVDRFKVYSLHGLSKVSDPVGAAAG